MPFDIDDVGAKPLSPISKASQRRRELEAQQVHKENVAVQRETATTMQAIRDTLTSLGSVFGVAKGVMSAKEADIAPQPMGMAIKSKESEIKQDRFNKSLLDALGHKPMNVNDRASQPASSTSMAQSKEATTEGERRQKAMMKTLKSIDANTKKMANAFLSKGQTDQVKDSKSGFLSGFVGGWLAGGIRGFFGIIFKAVGKIIPGIIKGAFVVGLGLTKIVFKAVGAFGKGLLKLIGLAVRAIPGVGWLIHGAFSAIFGGIPRAIDEWKRGGNFWGILKAFVSGTFNQFFIGYGDSILKWLNESVIEPFKDFFKMIWDKIKSLREWIFGKDPHKASLTEEQHSSYQAVAPKLDDVHGRTPFAQPQRPITMTPLESQVGGARDSLEEMRQKYNDIAMSFGTQPSQKDIDTFWGGLTTPHREVGINALGEELKVEQNRERLLDSLGGMVSNTDTQTTLLLDSMASPESTFSNVMTTGKSQLNLSSVHIPKSSISQSYEDIDKLKTMPTAVQSTTVVAPSSQTNVSHSNFTGVKQPTQNMSNSYSYFTTHITSGDYAN